MSDCEWDDPHDGYARFCLTHECWITAPVTVTTCPISDLLGKVQRVRELPILGKAPQGNTALRGYNDGWNACRMATLRALDGDGDE